MITRQAFFRAITYVPALLIYSPSLVSSRYKVWLAKKVTTPEEFRTWAEEQ